MTNRDKLVEQHIMEYESRRKHFDELMERAEKGISEKSDESELSDELAVLRMERTKLIDHIDQLKKKTREEWQEETIEQAGPMFIWEATAKRLESLIERIES